MARTRGGLRIREIGEAELPSVRGHLLRLGREFREHSESLDVGRPSALFEEDPDDGKTSSDYALAGGGRLLLAEIDGVPVGYALGFPPSPGESRPALVVSELFVTASARGLGVGRILLREAIGVLSRGPDRAEVAILEAHARQGAPAERLYASEGFEPLSVTMIKEL